MISKFLSILVEIIAPVIFIAGAGYLLQRRLDIDVRTLSRTNLYFLSPCLGFSAMVKVQMVRGDLARMAAISVLVILVMLVLGWVLAQLLQLERERASAMMIGLAFTNCGNYGLSICYFAFGDPGLALGTLYFIPSAVLTSSVGALIASRGGGSRTWAEALRNALGLPLLYATALGLTANLAGWHVPEPLVKATDLAGKASVPILLLVLGMQLTRARLGKDWPTLTLGTAVRLLIGPAVGLALANALHLSGVAWQVAVLQSAMPAAVTSVIITTEFRSAPEYASGMVLTTTLTSILTLTVLMALIT
ncbi:MAG: AEC family transporter [Anaerolineae bacterium]